MSVVLGWGPADFEAAELATLGRTLEEAMRLKRPPDHG